MIYGMLGPAVISGSNVSHLYRMPGFLDAESCARIRRAMDAGDADQAEVLDGTIAARDRVRRAWSIEPEASIIREVEQCLDRQCQAIARFFGIPLSGREGTGFLRYPPGGFYMPHRDRAVLASWPDAARRAIAVIVFLNGSRDGQPDGEFDGGTLRLFVEGDVVDVAPRPGLLVAFAADLLHEVTAVQGGTRDAVVDWFYGS